MQVKCPPYGGANPTMTVYYAQNGDAGLTLYKEIATISTAGKIIYEFNEEGISADYWVVRFTSSGWIDLRLCSPIGLFTTGLYTKECYQQIMDRVNGSTSGGNYQPKGNYVTTDTTQTISAKKTFSNTPELSAIPNKKVIGTGANGLIEEHTLAIGDITNLQTSLNGKANVGHTHAISEITNLQSTLNGKANIGHGHAISAITNLQTTLNNKQDKIEYPCSFNGSNGNYVKLIRAGTNNYYVEIEHGSATYNGSTTQYPEIKVTFPHEFNVKSANDKPTVIVSFAPTSNSTGTYEALKVINVTSTGFTVITRMSAAISGGYFRVNWIAIYTV